MSSEPLVVRPLAGIVEPAAFIRFHANPRRWEMSALVEIELPGIPFRELQGDLWASRPGVLTFWPGWGWDGSSGPAADTPDTWIASGVHDLVCTQIHGVPVLPGYFRRHALYCRLVWAQRPRPAPRRGLGRILDGGRVAWCATRVGLDYVGLVLGNWLLALTAREAA